MRLLRMTARKWMTVVVVVMADVVVWPMSWSWGGRLAYCSRQAAHHGQLEKAGMKTRRELLGDASPLVDMEADQNPRARSIDRLIAHHARMRKKYEAAMWFPWSGVD